MERPTQPPPPQTYRSWECVGYALVDWLATETGLPRSRLPNPTALYQAAQYRDGLPLPHNGTYVRAGFQTLANWHWINPDSEHYASTLIESNHLLQSGPVVVVVSALGTSHAIMCYGKTPDGLWLCQDSSRFTFHPRDGDQVWSAEVH